MTLPVKSPSKSSYGANGPVEVRCGPRWMRGSPRGFFATRGLFVTHREDEALLQMRDLGSTCRRSFLVNAEVRVERLPESESAGTWGWVTPPEEEHTFSTGEIRAPVVARSAKKSEHPAWRGPAARREVPVEASHREPSSTGRATLRLKYPDPRPMTPVGNNSTEHNSTGHNSTCKRWALEK